MTSSATLHPLPWNADALSMYQRLLPAEFFRELSCRTATRQNNRVYTFPVVMWLMIGQRLGGGASLESAVLQLLRGLPATFWPKPCRRMQRWRQMPLSSHTGAYNKARQRLPLTVVQHSSDRIFEQLTAASYGGVPAIGRRTFFFDGTSVRLAHSDKLCQSYPPSSNSNGDSHWPVIRMLVAHDLQSGLAMRPEWGPMYGARAVSEQRLFEISIQRLPLQSVVVGDANFGVFSVAYTTVQHDHDVLLRLTQQRAERLAGGPLQDGTDRQIAWKPSRDDRRSHPDLPAEACVRGRLIVRQVQPSDGAAPFLLALFTTLDLTIDEVLKLYGQRWNIETDLRSLKSTLQLEQLTCSTPEMVAKELNLAMAAYNLVRAVTCLASQQTGIPPRGYSFTRVQNVINAFTPLIVAAQNACEAQQHFDRMMYYVKQAKLPHRNRKRPSYPRAIWPRGESFPKRKA
jgi:putative transposase